MKDDKSKLKFISIISGLIIAIIAGYFGGISSGFHLYEIQKRELEKDIIARFILNDNYNISVACNILSAIKNEAGLPLFYYNTKTYKDDYHVVLISERYDIGNTIKSYRNGFIK